MAKVELKAGRGYKWVSPICAYCKRLEDSYERTCEAFEEIPDEIFDGDNDHTQPFKGDGGKQFIRFNQGDR